MLDYAKIMATLIADVAQSYTTKDTILYALGLGVGSDPMDERQLRFVYEKGLQALPTMGGILGRAKSLADNPEFGIDRKLLVAGEQEITIHRPLPPESDIVARHRVRDIADKGEGKGAIIYQEREISERATGDKLCTIRHSLFARGDGGFGGGNVPGPEMRPTPDRAPDITCAIPTLPQMALLYRLSGDYTLIHVDPERAKAAGFKRPVLHGLGTFGVAGYALLQTVCDWRPERLRSIYARFSKPVFPGDTITTEIWREPDGIAFQGRVAGRDAIVLSNGWATID